MQTVLFTDTGFVIGFLYQEKTSESMAKSIDLLQHRLDPLAFSRLFPLLLTDRGAEFERFRLFEQDASGQCRLRIFYCDPMQSSQKPHIENNHNYVRDILPNGYPLKSVLQFPKFALRRLSLIYALSPLLHAVFLFVDQFSEY